MGSGGSSGGGGGEAAVVMVGVLRRGVQGAGACIFIFVLLCTSFSSTEHSMTHLN